MPSYNIQAGILRVVDPMPAQAGFVLSVLAEGKEKANPESFKEKGRVPYGSLYTSISRNSSMKDAFACGKV